MSRSSPNAGGRRRGPQRVVPTAEDEILAVLQSPGVVQYLQRWRLLASTLTCRCRRIVQMQVLRQHTDGYAFRCGHCRQKRCLRTGSIFFGSKLSLQTLLRICYKFVEGVRAKRCATEEMPVNSECDRYLLVMVNVTITGGRRKSGRLERAKQWRLDKLADEGTDRRCEMIVAVAC
ncbi:hypothetical protein SprV_0501957900 [Sparganum proliferum]